MRVRGFTLVEVLVALAIVATALLAGTRAIGSMAQTSRGLKLHHLASMSAQNRLAVARASGQFLPLGSSSSPCPQGNVAFVCREEIKATPNPLFRRIEVRVYEEGDEEYFQAEVVGVLVNENGV